MNARVGNKPINFVLGTNGENIIRMEGNWQNLLHKMSWAS
jgi:hypothetical protein